MNTRSKSIAPNTTIDMITNVNTLHTPAEPTREEAMPSWARALLESMQAINIKLDQQDNRIKNLESLKNPIHGKLALLKESFQKNLLMIILIPLILYLLMTIIQRIGLIINITKLE